YLKGQPKLGLWYPRDSPFDLEAFSNSDYAGASLDRKFTIGAEAEYVAAVHCYGQNLAFHSKTKHIEIRHHFIRDSYEKKLIQVIKIHTDQNVADLLTKAFDASRLSILSIWCCIEGRLMMSICSQELMKGHVGDEAVHKELGDRMERAATTASSLEAEQDSGSGPRCQDTILGGVDAQTSIEVYTARHKLNTASIKLVLLENEEMEITATINGRVKTIPKASIRRHLKLEDSDGIPTLPNAKIFKQLALMGYASYFDKLTFQKGHFSPQWRFLIHTILHCLSPKKTAWEQFSRNIATAIICLATNRTFNFSKMICEGMLKNLDSRSKFLMYPRFIQIFLNKHKIHLLPHKITYVAPTLTQKLSNMKRVSKGYTREDIPLFPTMLTAPELSPSRITSFTIVYHPKKHIHPTSQQHTPPFIAKLSLMQRTATMPHDSSQPRVQSLGSDEGSLTLNELTVLCTTLSKKVEDLQNDLKQTKLTYGAAYTKLILRVKKLEHKVKASKSRRRARVIISDNEEDLEDSYKQGRIIAEIDQNPSISLVQDEGTSWIQEDAETQGRTSADTEILLEQEEPTELVEDPGSGEKGEKEISTAEVLVSTASAIPEVSTAIPKRQVYIKRSAEKRKDKGKAKQLQEEIDIARQEQEKYDLAQALELQKELDKRKEGVAKTTQAQDSEIEKEVMKRYGFDFQKPPAKRQKVGEVSGSIEEQYAGKEKDVYQVFEEMLKRFDRDDLEKLWDLVNKKFSSTEPTIDKEERYMNDPLKWRLYDTCGVHHVSTERGQDIFMLVEKDYPLTRARMTVMLVNKLQVDESSEMANELLRKIFYQVERQRT
ncbi:hypothetical protein Tco_1578266, partial [Tanacetum coccineum]